MDDYALRNLIKKTIRHELSKLNFESLTQNELNKIDLESIIRKIVKEEIDKILTNSKSLGTKESITKDEESLKNI